MTGQYDNSIFTEWFAWGHILNIRDKIVKEIFHRCIPGMDNYFIYSYVLSLKINLDHINT